MIYVSVEKLKKKKKKKNCKLSFGFNKGLWNFNTKKLIL
jgi:hypothetical protein